MLVESFPHARHHYTAYYTFEGWNANQSLGMLITRRMEDRGLQPLGFVANDYTLAVWGLQPVIDPADFGLALALAGRPGEAVQMLDVAARAQGAELILCGYNSPIHYPPDPSQDILQGFHNALVMQAGA